MLSGIDWAAWCCSDGGPVEGAPAYGSVNCTDININIYIYGFLNSLRGNIQYGFKAPYFCSVLLKTQSTRQAVQTNTVDLWMCHGSA